MIKRTAVVLACLLALSLFVPTPAGAAPTCAGKTATIVGTQDSDRLRGTEGDDVIVGRGGFDEIEGLGGDDAICGGRSTDLLYGGRGNDRLLGGLGFDLLDGGSHDDRVELQRSGGYAAGGPGDDAIIGGPGAMDIADYFAAPQGVAVDLGTGIATGDGNDSITAVEQVRGSNFDDLLTGDENPNVLSGEGGDDTLTGGGGGSLSGPRPGTSSFGRADLYYGKGGNDTMIGSEDFDVVSWFDAPSGVTVDLAAGRATGEGDDTLSDIDGVHSSRNGDTISGDGGDNAFALEGGSDMLDGRGGVDLLFVTALAPDGVVVDLAAGTSSGGGTDVIRAIEDVWGTPGDDTLRGDDGPNGLSGRAGNDSLFGEEGDDVLSGGLGRDDFDGGDGFDLCEQPPEGDFTDCENP